MTRVLEYIYESDLSKEDDLKLPPGSIVLDATLAAVAEQGINDITAMVNRIQILSYRKFSGPEIVLNALVAIAGGIISDETIGMAGVHTIGSNVFPAVVNNSIRTLSVETVVYCMYTNPDYAIYALMNPKSSILRLRSMITHGGLPEDHISNTNTTGRVNPFCTSDRTKSLGWLCWYLGSQPKVLATRAKVTLRELSTMNAKKRAQADQAARIKLLKRRFYEQALKRPIKQKQQANKLPPDKGIYTVFTKALEKERNPYQAVRNFINDNKNKLTAILPNLETSVGNDIIRANMLGVIIASAGAEKAKKAQTRSQALDAVKTAVAAAKAAEATVAKVAVTDPIYPVLQRGASMASTHAQQAQIDANKLA